MIKRVGSAGATIGLAVARGAGGGFETVWRTNLLADC